MDVPQDSPRRQQEGIYYSKTFAEGKLKVFFLDCRYFRDAKAGDLLGEAQWQWFEEEMANSQSQVHLICSSYKVLRSRLVVTETWAEERASFNRLFDLIFKYDLPNVFFISGDQHFGAFDSRSIRRGGKRREFQEVMSSGLTHLVPKPLQPAIKLTYKKGTYLLEKNFGKMELYPKHLQFSLNSLGQDKALSSKFLLS